jgi:hypothetical protein
MALKLPKLDKTMEMAEGRWRNPATGKIETIKVVATPDFQRWWQSAVVRADTASSDATLKVTQLNSVIYTAPTISNPPTQAQVQAIANALAQIAEAMTE